jgi:hypothetical protein
MISAQCPLCHEVFAARDEFAGQAVQCHNCGTPTPVGRARKPRRQPPGRSIVIGSLALLMLALLVSGLLRRMARSDPAAVPQAAAARPSEVASDYALAEINRRERETAEHINQATANEESRTKAEAVETAHRAEQQRRTQAEQARLRREFSLLPNEIQFAIGLVREKKTIQNVEKWELAAVLPYWQHTQFTRDQIIEALAVIGDDYGAAEQIKILGVTNPVERVRLRVTFGLLGPADAMSAVQIAKRWRTNPNGLSDDEKAFIKRNPTAFPESDR